MNSLERSYQSKKNNSQGQLFEKVIEQGCHYYFEKGMANISKTPEPFRVLKKLPGGKFQGQFIKKADPDFKGTLRDGRCIVFECKYTNKKTISKNVLSINQKLELDKYCKLNAFAMVCVCFGNNLQERYFFIPYEIWKDMEKYYKRKSVTAEQLSWWEVACSYSTGVRFLEYINRPSMTKNGERVVNSCENISGGLNNE